MAKSNHIPVYKLKKGDSILISNTQLDKPIAACSDFKIFSATITDIQYEEYGDDMRYKLTMGEYTSGWYDRGYLFHYDFEGSIATPLETTFINEENKK
jgi:hypothetical protein